MKIVIILTFFCLPLFAEQKEVVTMARYFTMKTCYQDKECLGPVAKNVETANIEMQLKPFKKIDVTGFDSWERNTLEEGGVIFKSEIHLMKIANPGKYKYKVYAMLRSGKRKAKVKNINLKTLADLQYVTLSDAPVKSKNGTLQAQLVFGPKLNLESK